MDRLPLAVGLAILIGVCATGAGTGPGSAAAQQEQVLELRRKEVELREAQDLLARRDELYRENLISETELRQARTALEMARLSYQQALLAALDVTPRLSVLSAVKRQEPDGRKFVKLKIANLTRALDAAGRELLKELEGLDSLPEELVLGGVSDVFVSLRDNGRPREAGDTGVRGTTIGLPYEILVERLDYGENRLLEFQLLKDVDSLAVFIDHRSRRQEIDLQLQQAETRNLVALSSTQLSQEGDLGSQVTYNLRLERSTVDVRGFVLKVLNLPRQVSYSFIDPANEARLSQFSFPAGVTQRTLGLRLFLPDRRDERVKIDEPLTFWAVVLDDRQAESFREDRIYSDEEIASSRAGRVQLQIIPRGIGRAELTAASLFSEVQPGETASSELTVRNSGSRRLDNVKLIAEGPLRWPVRLSPELIPALEVDREKTVALEVTAAPDAPVGDYEVRVKMESSAYGRPVPSEEKIFRVSVAPAANLWGAVALISAPLAILAGLLIFGIRLARR